MAFAFSLIQLAIMLNLVSGYGGINQFLLTTQLDFGFRYYTYEHGLIKCTDEPVLFNATFNKYDYGRMVHGEIVIPPFSIYEDNGYKYNFNNMIDGKCNPSPSLVVPDISSSKYHIANLQKLDDSFLPKKNTYPLATINNCKTKYSETSNIIMATKNNIIIVYDNFDFDSNDECYNIFGSKWFGYQEPFTTLEPLVITFSYLV